MIDAEAAQDRRLDVVYVNGIGYDVVGEIVGFAVGDAGLNAASGHPHREAAGMVVAAVVAVHQLALAVDGPAEFAAPDDERVVEKSALFQILYEGG